MPVGGDLRSQKREVWAAIRVGRTGCRPPTLLLTLLYTRRSKVDLKRLHRCHPTDYFKGVCVWYMKITEP